jgi:oligoribonuclease NrnB/cAMP/cGMP phosphodiesterase (DHH superfamily)
MTALCIYHGNCQDGFGSAWAVRHALGDAVEFYPGVYQNEPPDVTGRDVIMVDFTYKSAVVQKMASTARSILILDHHKSAAADFADFPEGIENLTAFFDMDRSGAGMAWDHYHPGTPRPKLLDHIEDRDLWRHPHAGS